MSFGIWIYGRWATPDRAKIVRGVATFLGTVIFYWVQLSFYMRCIWQKLE